MKALTLTQPWASLVALGHKHVETRSWSTNYRGPFYVHAAKGYPRYAKQFAGEEWAAGRLPADLPLGFLLATARIVEVRRTEDVSPTISELERSYGDYYPGRYAWLLEDIEPLTELIQWKGSLGLFNVDIPVNRSA